MFEIPTTESGPHGRYRDHVLLRCYLRFLWWKDSHLDEEMVEVKMCAHVFGGTSSTTCSIYALKKTSPDNKEKCGQGACSILRENRGVAKI